MQMITDHFDAGANRHPDNVCLQGPGLSLTYAEVQADSHAIGHALTLLGLSCAHVGVLAPNHPLSFVAMLGALRAGSTFIPLNARDSIDSLIWFMSFTKLSVLVLHSQYAEHAERIRAGVPSLKTLIGLDEPIDGLSIASWCRDHAGQECTVRQGLDDIALIKSSGGTTGRPKAIMQSHRALLACYRIGNQFMPPAKSPAHLVVAPLTHAAGATAMALSSFGTRNVIAASADPGVVLETIERERITHLFLPPTLIYRLLSHPDARTRDCSSLEYVIYGAAPMSVDKLREGIALWGPVFVQFYGQSEVPGVITVLTREDHLRDGKHLGSAGRPTGACEVALMDDDGRIVETGERGEIVARGELVAPGYYDNPQANEEARRFGWHHTGDIGVFDEGGYLYIVDRTKDMIISGGFNLYPSEIEQVIWAHPAVMDCAVVGIPDADWGEKVIAVIELKAGACATAQEFIATCREKLGSLKTPKHVLFWDSLPRSPVGKVLKKDVRAQLIAQEPRP